MKGQNKAPYIQNSGEWPACGWKINGTFYEEYETRENIYPEKTGETSSGQLLPRLLV
jgi:hypothetical protein